jgi:hypothetical protein
MARAAAPKPVICVIEHLYRDESIAAAAREGRFTHAGTTLDLGLPPDWIDGGLPEDDEWRIEWVKLYEGLDLAHTYSVTGDRSFLAAWECLVESFCDQVPVGHDSSDVSARRVQNWLYAWQRFAGHPEFSGLRPGLAERLVQRIAADCRHLADHLTAERNHRTLELYTLLLASLALGADRAETARVLELLTENAVADVWEDGVHRECSTDYHLIVLRSLVGVIANARAAGLQVPDVLLDRTGRAADFALHVQRPDGLTPAISDGDQGDFRALLTLAATVLDRSELLWAASGGTRGRPPRSRNVSFPVGGYHVQRSGWGDGERSYADERFALFDCGPLGDGGHGHYDALSVELAGGGAVLAVDPGRFTYAEEADGWRRWFKGTAAHNTVTVDGRDQTPYRRGKPKGPVAQARLLDRHNRPGLDVLVGQVTSPVYDAVHTRVLAFVDDDYWVVHDRLRAPTQHRYEARWHLSPEVQGLVEIRREARQVTVVAPGLVLAVPEPAQVWLEDGWVSRSYGIRLPAPVVVVALDGTADADLVTVLAPDPTGALHRSGLDLIAVPARDEAEDTVVRVRRMDVIDTICWGIGYDWSRRPC